MKYIFIVLIIFYPMISYSFEFTANSEQAEECYGKAMVGLDSVINSRIGVPPEHAVYLTNSGEFSEGENTYYDDLLIIMLDAYLWSQSPHSYAVNVFYNCAANNNNLKNAHLNTDSQ